MVYRINTDPKLRIINQITEKLLRISTLFTFLLIKAYVLVNITSCINLKISHVIGCVVYENLSFMTYTYRYVRRIRVNKQSCKQHEKTKYDDYKRMV